MRLGIDFGTTSTVVAWCDRGNYPVVHFSTQEGDHVPFFPSVVAERGGELRFGFDALACDPAKGWWRQRSFKRLLSSTHATMDSSVQVGSLHLTLAELTSRYLQALRHSLLTASNLPSRAREVLEVSVATPANAFSTQRLVTLGAFRSAGFEVVSMLNEPSAAGIEYAHRYRSTLNSLREQVLVYDLGGGTFDVSLVDMQGQAHDVKASRGLSHLGGDDFDRVLALTALRAAKLEGDALAKAILEELCEHCRDLKEKVHANTRKLYVELGRWAARGLLPGLERPSDFVQVVSIQDFEADCEPLLSRTVELLDAVLLDGQGGEEVSNGVRVPRDVAGLYVVGGGSALPAVGRRLRAEYGRRVHRSPHPSAAVAIGLAIAADETSGYDVTRRFQHSLGVFREAEGGRMVDFDPIIGPHTPLPQPGQGPTILRRRYRPTHNLGHFRFVECGWLNDAGQPSGDIKPYADVLFPFDPALQSQADLSQVQVARRPWEGSEIEEQYLIDEAGAVELTITDCAKGFQRNYRIAG